jgi:O-antigen/teichoic acid export membrane protein
MKKRFNFRIWYSGLPIALKASFWFTVCNVLQRGISVITTPIFTRILSEEQYGIYSTYLTWESLLLIVVSLSLHKSIMNLLVKTDKTDHVLTSVVCLSLLITGVWLLVAISIAPWLSQWLKLSVPLVICLFVYTTFFPVIECWTIERQFAFDYKKVAIETLLSSILSAGVGVLAVLFVSSTAEARVIPQVATAVLVAAVLLVFIFRKDRKGYDKKIWLFSLSFCLPLLPHYLSEFVLSGFDKLMINYMCSSEDVAAYSIAYSAGSIISLVTSAINSAFAPYQYKMIKAQKFDILKKVANVVLLLVAVMLCIIMLFGREIILVFGGEKYLQAEACVIPICVGLFFNYLFQLFARVQEYYEHRLLIAVPSILCAGLNVLLNYIYIKKYGYVAASYTTVVCYFLFCLLHFAFYKYTCKKENGNLAIYDAKGLFLISAGLIASAIGLYFIRDYLWVRLSVFGVFLILLFIFRKKIFSLFKILFSKDDANGTPSSQDIQTK